jgi:hypothetical protein
MNEVIIKPPCCPDCETPMIYIREDTSEQGGPPENTWLCDNKECRRGLKAEGVLKIFPHPAGPVSVAYDPQESVSF